MRKRLGHSSGGEDDDMAAEAVNGAILEAPRDDAAARSILHDEFQRKILDEEFDLVLQALLVKGMQ
jgi:hypothetical protein